MQRGQGRALWLRAGEVTGCRALGRKPGGFLRAISPDPKLQIASARGIHAVEALYPGGCGW